MLALNGILNKFNDPCQDLEIHHKTINCRYITIKVFISIWKEQKSNAQFKDKFSIFTLNNPFKKNLRKEDELLKKKEAQP